MVPGYHRVMWDRRNESVRFVSAGVYFVALEMGDARLTKKVVLQ